MIAKQSIIKALIRLHVSKRYTRRIDRDEGVKAPDRKVASTSFILKIMTMNTLMKQGKELD